MRRAWWCVVLLAACSEPMVPSRADVYPFDAGGEVFHWPTDGTPVRVYAQPVGNLPFLAQRASDAWAAQFLYGEFQGEPAADSMLADVIVQADSAPDVPPDPGTPVFACFGQTDVPPYSGPLHIQLFVLPSFTAPQVAACLRRTAIHEMGHALGLLQHSPNPDDIMWGPTGGQPLTADLPSERDHRTIEVLYHTPPTILPPP